MTTTASRPNSSNSESATATVSPQAVKRHVLVAAVITAVGGMLFGYDTGVVSGALLFLKSSFGGLSSFQQELVTSLLLVGAAVGALVAGRVADQIGRKRAVLITAATFIVGVALAAFAPAFWLLLTARIIIGLGVGASSMVVPLYIGEVAPPRIRGALVSFNQLAITSGILVSYLADYGLQQTANWRLMFGLAAIPAAILFFGIMTQHESPAWLVRQGREDEARQVLRRIRAEDDIDAEVEDIRGVARKEGSGSELLSKAVRPALVVGVALAVLQQVTGINTVIYYAPSLLQGAGLGDRAALLANVAVGAINVLLTIVSIWLLDKVGRRPLLLTGTAGMVIGMIITAVAFVGHGTTLNGSQAVVAVVGLMVYTGAFAVGLGPVFWLIIAEIYPLGVRARAMSVATIANWAANFVVTISFLTILNAIGGAGIFTIFGALSLVALLFFWRKVPETKGRTLQEIERDLGGELKEQDA